MKTFFKRSLAVLLAALMTISLPFSAYAEGEENTGDHKINYESYIKDGVHYCSAECEDCDSIEHNYKNECSNASEVSANNAVAATCTKAGKEADTICSVCGEIITKGEATPLAEHSFTNYISNDDADDATCTKDGKTASKTATCAYNCGEIDTIIGTTIPAKGHKEADELYNVKSPTCKTEGYTGDKVCSVCNAILEKGKSIDKVEHSYVLKTSPECNKDDSAIVLTYECIYCGEKGTEYSVIVGHTPFVDETTAVEPTCEKAGKKADTVCSKCEKTLVEGDEIPATGHKWENGKCTNKDCDAKATPVLKSINKTKYFIDEKFDSEIVLKYQYDNKDTGEEVTLDGSKIEVTGYDNTKAQSLTDCKITYDKTDITLPTIKICSTDIKITKANGELIKSSYGNNILDGTDSAHPLTIGDNGMYCSISTDLENINYIVSNENVVITETSPEGFRINSKDGKNPGYKERYTVTITGNDNQGNEYKLIRYLNFGIKDLVVTNYKNDYSVSVVYGKNATFNLKCNAIYYYGTPKKNIPITLVIESKYNKLVGKNTSYIPAYFGLKQVFYYTVKVPVINVPKLSKPVAGSKKFTAKWTKPSGYVTGYYLQYSTSSKFSKAKTVKITKNTTLSKTISKLSGKKKYYVRVRAYYTYYTYDSNYNAVEKTAYSKYSNSYVTTKK